MRSKERGMSISVRAKKLTFDRDTMWVELDDGRSLGVPLAWFPRPDARDRRSAGKLPDWPFRQWPALGRSRRGHLRRRSTDGPGRRDPGGVAGSLTAQERIDACRITALAIVGGGIPSPSNNPDGDRQISPGSPSVSPESPSSGASDAIKIRWIVQTHLGKHLSTLNCIWNETTHLF